MSEPICLIHPERLRDVWDKVKAGLYDMPPDDWIAEDVYHAIKSGDAVLYVCGDGFMVLRRIEEEFSRKVRLHVWLAHHPQGLDMYETGEALIRDCAMRMGAERITFGSPRKGWSKRYPMVSALYEVRP